MLSKVSSLNFLAIGQPSQPILVPTYLPDRNSVDFEVLQNGGSGGKNLCCNFLTTEPFFDVFLLEETLILIE